jgi:hypothetical protein
VESRRCEACGKGILNYDIETISIRQSSDKGPLVFSVTVPVGRCTNCDTWRITPEGEALIDAKAREVYESLAPKPTRRR